MAYKFLNGYGAPQITVQRIADKYNEAVITLDICNIEGGFNESYQEDYKRVELEYNSKLIDYDFRGARITFRLDYTSYCTADNLLNIELIHHYNSMPDLYQLFLAPRTVPNARRTFEVRLSGDTWDQGMMKNTSDGAGHKGVSISFITVYPESKQFYDTNDIAGKCYFYLT